MKPINYANIAREVLKEQNLLRSNPAKYAAKLEAQVSKFNGLVLELSPTVRIATKEGAAAYREAIDVLKRTAPLPILEWRDGPAKSSKAHCNDLGPKGKTGHDGTDGSTPFDRMKRFGEWKGGAAENIAFGPSDPTNIIINLFVDDDVPSRGHRTNILHPDFRVCGIALGKHKVYGTMCVLNYAVDFVDAPQPEESKTATLKSRAKKQIHFSPPLRKTMPAKKTKSTKSLTRNPTSPKLVDDKVWPIGAISLKTQVKTQKLETGMKVTTLRIYTFPDGSTKSLEKTTTIA
mmetsp:Transcript_26075/g.46308  ORF Transcript_26075/g.46308 Transcript_26075/m.46308 type:complete len:290 (-) Transcript_26075:5314-6183(-)